MAWRIFKKLPIDVARSIEIWGAPWNVFPKSLPKSLPAPCKDRKKELEMHVPEETGLPFTEIAASRQIQSPLKSQMSQPPSPGSSRIPTNLKGSPPSGSMMVPLVSWRTRSSEEVDRGLC